MATYVTTALRAALSTARIDADELAERFEQWKSGGANSEYSEYLFGKDVAYEQPTVNGERNVLWHVHLVPLANKEQLSKWKIDFQRRRRKVSDRALVYVSNDLGNHLLIYILNDPGAHDTAKMKTPQDRALMLKLAKIADDFIHAGKVP